MIYYVQKGDNPKYPQKITTWRLGEKIPDWISDNARILSLDLVSGKPKLKMRDTYSGGFEIIGANGISTLVSAKTQDSYVCYDLKSKIFSLTSKQFNLLYEKIDQ